MSNRVKLKKPAKKRTRRPGRGKAKGSAFERKICKELSLWVSHGKREDLFWRSAMSGGRTTVGARKGKDFKKHAGDISATHVDGHKLTDEFFVECKFVKDLGLHRFFLGLSCPLQSFYRIAKEQASVHDLEPMVIAQQNFSQVIVVLPRKLVAEYDWALESWCARVNFPAVAVLIFDDMVKQRFHRGPA